MTKPVLPRLHTPEEIAEALGCSAWWVREQARRRRIPFTKVGGAYRFTTAHLHEIVDIFEERPTTGASGPETHLAPPRHGSGPAPVVQLHARPPRRRRAAAAQPASDSLPAEDRKEHV